MEYHSTMIMKECELHLSTWMYLTNPNAGFERAKYRKIHNSENISRKVLKLAKFFKCFRDSYIYRESIIHVNDKCQTKESGYLCGETRGTMWGEYRYFYIIFIYRFISEIFYDNLSIEIKIFITFILKFFFNKHLQMP